MIRRTYRGAITQLTTVSAARRQCISAFLHTLGQKSTIIQSECSHRTKFTQAAIGKIRHRLYGGHMLAFIGELAVRVNDGNPEL
jgi:hypothetical protein